eukprot:XP_001704257.1 Hypothetical protein GL50803_31272 [Giardia lamblia ATCC 50803]
MIIRLPVLSDPARIRTCSRIWDSCRSSFAAEFIASYNLLELLRPHSVRNEAVHDLSSQSYELSSLSPSVEGRFLSSNSFVVIL